MYAMKARKGRGPLEGRLFSFLTSTLGESNLVGLTPSPTYPGKELQYSLNRKLSGHQSRSGLFGEEISLLSLKTLISVLFTLCV
jgi:hypothetical protein